MKRKTPAKNISAFSILEVMVVAGLMSIIGLSITSVVTNSTKSQKRIELKDVQTSTSSHVRGVLQSGSFCKNAFCATGSTCDPVSTTIGPLAGLPKSAAEAATLNTTPLTLQGIQTFSGAAGATKTNVISCIANCNTASEQPADAGPWGTPIGTTGLHVYKMRLINFVYQGLVAGNHTTTADLQIRYTRDPQKTMGGQFQDSIIKMIIAANPAGQITSCSTGAGDSLWQNGAASGEIYYDVGLVGIGTNDPSRPLEISGTGTSTVLGQLNTALKLTTLTATVNAGNEIVFSGSGGSDAQNVYAAISALATENTTGADGELVFSNKSTQAAIALSERMRITRGGNVGIGINNPSTLLDVNGDTSVGDHFWMNASGSIGSRGTGTAAQRTAFEFTSANGTGAVSEAKLNTAGLTRLTASNAGDVGIGTTTPGSKLDVAGNLLLSGAGTKTISTANGSSLEAKATGNAAFSIWTNGVKRIDVLSGGATTIDQALTVSNGGLNLLTAAGNLTVGGNANVGGNLFVTGTITGSTTLAAASATIPILNGNIQHNGNLRGNTGQITNYSLYQVSDRTLKRDIVPLADQTEFLEQLGIYSFKYIKDQKNTEHFGVIAQEIQKIYPNLVITTEDGKLNVNYVELIPILIKSLQESNAEIKNLKEQQAKTSEDLKKLIESINKKRAQ